MPKTKQKQIRFNVDKVYAAIENKDADTLRSLHGDYSARMRHDGAMIWQIGSIFIPLSLSGIVLGLDDPHRTLAVGCFSMLLIWIWYSVSVVINNSLDRNLAICAVIESVLLRLDKPLKRSGLNDFIKDNSKSFKPRLRKIRLAIPILITLGWIGVVVLSFLA